MVGHLLNIDKPFSPKGGGRFGPGGDARPSQSCSRNEPGIEGFGCAEYSPKRAQEFRWAHGRCAGGRWFSDGNVEVVGEALKSEGASLRLIAPRVGAVQGDDGKAYRADEKIDGGPSVLFDAVVLLLSEEAAEQLATQPAARDFVADALAHKKFIAHTSGAKSLIEAAGGKADSKQLLPLERDSSVAEFVKSCRKLRVFADEGK